VARSNTEKIFTQENDYREDARVILLLSSTLTAIEKIILYMFSSDKVLTCNQPLYHSHLLASYTPACTVRSRDKCLLTVPTVSPITGGRGFSYAAPSIGMYRIVNFTIRPVPDSTG